MKTTRALRVLLADHQESSRIALRRLLESAGHEVQSAATAAEVMLSCEAATPDVVILDLNLPDTDGFELCACVRRELRDDNVTIILATSRHDKLTRHYLHQMAPYAGGDYFFTKPCDGKLIVSLLEQIAERDAECSGQGKACTFPTRVVWPTARQRQHVLMRAF